MTMVDISDNGIVYTSIIKSADIILKWREELHRNYGTGIHTFGYKIDYKKDKDFGFFTLGGSVLYDRKKVMHEILTSFTHWLMYARTTDANYLHIDECRNAFSITTIHDLKEK